MLRTPTASPEVQVWAVMDRKKIKQRRHDLAARVADLEEEVHGA